MDDRNAQKVWEAWSKNQYKMHKNEGHRGYQNVKKLNAGKYYAPVLNARQIRKKAIQAKNSVHGNDKYRMTQLIKLTHKNPYLHRREHSWDGNRTNLALNTTMQRKLNLVYHYTQKNPDTKLSEWKSDLRAPYIASGNNIYSRINYATNMIDGSYKLAKQNLHQHQKYFDKPKVVNHYKSEVKRLYPWHCQIKNINNADFYTKQLPYIEKAKDQHAKQPKISAKQFYLHNGNHFTNNAHEPIHATASNWKKFHKLTKISQENGRRYLHSRSPLSKVHNKKQRHMMPGQKQNKVSNQAVKAEVINNAPKRN